MSEKKVRVLHKKRKDILSYLVWLMDRSGSMQGLKEVAVGGYTQFVADQKELPGEAIFTLAQFDNHFEILQSMAPIKKAFEYTAANFIPRGGTALRDAIGKLMAIVEEDINLMEKKPDVVLLGIMTDGEENSSREFSQEMIKEKISEWEGRGWKVIFLSSEPKAVDMALHNFGLNPNQVSGFSGTRRGMKSAFGGASNYATSMRAGLVPDKLTADDEE